MRNPKQEERFMYPMPSNPTVESLRLVWQYRRAMRPLPRPQLQRNRLRRPKPSQPTIVRRKTVRSMNYVMGRRLATFVGCNLVIAAYQYRDPLTKTVEKIHDGSETCGV